MWELENLTLVVPLTFGICMNQHAVLAYETESELLMLSAIRTSQTAEICRGHKIEIRCNHARTNFHHHNAIS